MRVFLFPRKDTENEVGIFAFEEMSVESKQIQIRDATMQDADAIIANTKAMAEELDNKTLSADIASWIREAVQGSRRHGRYFVAVNSADKVVIEGFQEKS